MNKLYINKSLAAFTEWNAPKLSMTKASIDCDEQEEMLMLCSLRCIQITQPRSIKKTFIFDILLLLEIYFKREETYFAIIIEIGLAANDTKNKSNE